VKLAPEKGIVGKGKGRCTVIQGVTVPLNCRVFIHPQFLSFDFFLNPSVSLPVVY
jgi:hypothetical protein